MTTAYWRVLAVAVMGASVLGGIASAEKSGLLRIRPEEVRWRDVPDGHGVQEATLYGDPKKPGLYVIRVRFPPYLMDRPHWHPHARFVTVLEGTWYTGTGNTFDVAHAVPLKPGSLMVHPARAVHWDGSGKGEAVVVQIVGDGPGDSTPVDPARSFWVEVPH